MGGVTHTSKVGPRSKHARVESYTVLLFDEAYSGQTHLVIPLQRRVLMLFAYEAVTHRKGFGLSAHETPESVLRRADDRLTAR